MSFASITGSAWFGAVSKLLEELTYNLSGVQGDLETTVEDIAKNKALTESNLQALTQMSSNLEYEEQHFQEAQGRYYRAMENYQRAEAEHQATERVSYKQFLPSDSFR